MESSSAGIFQQPAPLFLETKAAVSVGLVAVATLFIIAISQWSPFTLVPASTAAEPNYELIIDAYFWSFIISIQVIAASVMYRPRIQQLQSHTS